MDELGGEPVEQLRMRGPFTLRSEIVDRPREPGPEELAPGAVDEGGGGQRVVTRHEPVRQVEACRALAFRVERAEESWNRRLDDRRRIVHPVAAWQNARLCRIHRDGRHDVRNGRLEQTALGL